MNGLEVQERGGTQIAQGSKESVWITDGTFEEEVRSDLLFVEKEVAKLETSLYRNLDKHAERTDARLQVLGNRMYELQVMQKEMMAKLLSIEKHIKSSLPKPITSLDLGE